MKETIDPEKLKLLSYRNARNTLMRKLGMGQAYPLAELQISAREIGVFPNTETIIYATVGNNTREEIYIHQPEANTVYELVELNADEMSPQDKAEATARSLPDKNTTQQPVLTLKTPPITNYERTFSVKATAENSGLIRFLDKVVKVQAGINKDLEVTAEQQTIPYDHRATITIQNGQADCEYILVSRPGEEGTAHVSLSQPNYSIDSRTVVLQSFPLRENANLSVYAKFRTSGIDGYLETVKKINVIPHAFVPAEAEAATLEYFTEDLADQGLDPVLGRIILRNTQISALYQAVFTWSDLTKLPDPAPGSDETATGDFTNAHWSGVHSPGTPASNKIPGNGSGELVIPLNTYLPEDVTVKIEATNRDTGIKTELKVTNPGGSEAETRLIRFKIKPNPYPLVQVSPQTVPEGGTAGVIVQQAQTGAYYQLFFQDNDEPAGAPQFMSKKRPIGLAELEVDLSVNSETPLETQELVLQTPPVIKESTFYVKAIKPINTPLNQMESEGIRLQDTVTLKVNP